MISKFAFLLTRDISPTKSAQGSIQAKDDHQQLAWESWLKQSLPSDLEKLGVIKVVVSVFDHKVAQAENLRISNIKPPLQAVVFAYLNNSNDFEAVLTCIESSNYLLSAYRLSEYQMIDESRGLDQSFETEYDDEKGTSFQRVPGMMQLALLKVPTDMLYEEWLKIWRQQHTQVAIETQSTFIYRQNVVEECLTEFDLGFKGLVEEAFPSAAMTSQKAFYAATNEIDLKARQQRMWQSSKRFLKISDLEVLPTSQYCWDFTV